MLILLFSCFQYNLIDLCLSDIQTPVWSPDGRLIAYMDTIDDVLQVIVVDLGTLQAYIVARHSSESGEYSFPGMIGWHDAVDQ